MGLGCLDGNSVRLELNTDLQHAKEAIQALVDIQTNVPVVTSARAARAAARKAEKAVAFRRREIKGKAVCPEDNVSRRRVQDAASIATYFLSSRNSTNPQVLESLCDLIISNPLCISLRAAAKSTSVNVQCVYRHSHSNEYQNGSSSIG